MATPKRKCDAAFLAMALVADFAFIGIFVAYAFAEHYGIEASPLYGNVKFSFVDGGYPERYGYAQQAVATLLLLATYSKRRQPVYLMLALLFAVSVLDDSMALHEAMGNYFAMKVGTSVATGELVGWSTLGLLPMLAVLLGYLRSDSRSRRDAQVLFVAIVLLLFFAVGMDIVHGVIHQQLGRFQTVLTVIEDGGELVTFTLICALSLGIFRLHQELQGSFTDSR
ncbi:hypothetical protein [Aromatoleum anaerobium]|uniref:DUF998 domain-containing protein n=1 Tax=Aromatoleum anaerobium TaxID=182180 RepID=A0ABX1PK72_9RHOO|nr:hypothetical protein [Aromatoleum anaerobium]MCK0508245.1 hypothetical protein [Aromatoleum anaerobium]